MSIPTRVPLLFVGLVGCAGDKAPPAVVPPDPVCAAPTGEGDVGVADANHDGAVDVSDGVYTLRYLMNGGPAPACVAAQDLMRDDLVDMGDALAIVYYLFTPALELPGSGRLDCDEPTDIPDAACGVLQLSLDAPASVSAAAGSAATTQVGVMLTSPDLDVQAWSLGVTADGCTITGVSESGTVIADVRLDPEGKRDVGFSRADVVEGGVTHAGVLSWKTDVTLAPSADARRLLTLDVAATAPASGCAPCTLAFSDDLTGGGREVELVITASGQSYTPTIAGASVDVCAD